MWMRFVNVFVRIIQNPLEYFLHYFNNSKDNCSRLFQREDHGDLDNISYPRFVRYEWGFKGIIFFNYRDIGWEKSGFVIMSCLSCFQSTHV